MHSIFAFFGIFRVPSLADYFLSKLAYSAAGQLTNCKYTVSVNVNINLYSA